MTEYQAPLNDMMFLLQHVIGIEELSQFQSGDVDVSLAGAVLEEAGKFATGVLSPLNKVGDRQASTIDKEGHVTTPQGFKQAYAQFVEMGWNGVPFDINYGGQGLPWLVAFAVQEMMHSSNTSFCLCSLLSQAAVHAIHSHGSEEQKSKYLEKLTTGEWTGSMQLTEPQAGTDLAAIKTRAVLQEDGSYKITGQKIYITYGEHDLTENIIHLVLARASNAPEGVKGISLFIVPKYLLDKNNEPDPTRKNDVKATSLEHKLGIHASPTCVMQLGEQGGATGYLVGKENEGLKYMFTMMNTARLGVGLQGVAIAERAYQQALAYAKERVQSTKLGDKSGKKVPIIEHADVRRMLLSMKAMTEAGRALAYEAALSIDLAKAGNDQAQAKVDLLTPIVKAWCTDMAVEVSSTGIQVHGGMGYIEETGASQFYRDARILPIYEGTNGIQANDLVFRKIIYDGGSAMQIWFKEAENTLSELSSIDELNEMRLALKQNLDSLKMATDWVLSAGQEDLETAATVAHPYLHAFATIAGGVLMARSAIAATLQLEAGINKNFYKAKLLTAEYYTTHILSQAPCHLEAVFKGSAPIKKYTIDLFD